MIVLQKLAAEADPAQRNSLHPGTLTGHVPAHHAFVPPTVS